MKTYLKPIVPPTDSHDNHVGLLAWSLLASPQLNMVGGIPGQPGPDTPQPTEPGEPTLPDQPPPAPVA
ncbi:hypothetical protein QN382_21755 [Pseudomonas sp. 10B1]|uniref:hypothetical protein n=1 Tax=unclassified Pseudomonas TaxID=196821 RepID=UPI002AB40585|nr:MULTISPECIES: hypothetical protein [unclassified Pseudomonas]MDY7561602.1 hypothetical protein [Pseudomonas sp. AB6]MEA9978383.1 hypothetical protein [Pseudomonas sp. RTS4]MEA9994494.1 hypothetical protein [Pseudomonas sp. AA4]MEB0085638.1 hypothetical protein [Pseudomonas sp. RTI1]MEB0126036.1 hypothetical protein [Pseudomonas sp. CCC1.2]